LSVCKEEMEELRFLKAQADELAQKERDEADEVIHWLKEDKAKLERQLEAYEEDMALLKSDSSDTTGVLDRVSQEREAINELMARVAAVWEMANTSVSDLDDAMDKLRPADNTDPGSDRVKMLSTLESASLLHGQIKVSLLLIELKLRNQLECLKNDKESMGKAAPSDESVTQTMKEIQKDALTALSQVETALSNQMTELKETALNEATQTKIELQERVRKLEEMKDGYQRLEAEIEHLQDSNQGSDCFVPVMSTQIEQSEENKEGVQTIAISSPVMKQLQAEVLRIVERIQEKNKVIASLKEELEEHKLREENLRKELKRTLRANHASQNVAKNSPRTPTKIQSPLNGSKGMTKKLSPVDKKRLSSSPLSLQSPTSSKTPVKVKDALAARNGLGKSPASANSALYTPNSSIKPLQPSPRDRSRPRHLPPGTPPWVSDAGGVVDSE
jgi:hypothetical protein